MTDSAQGSPSAGPDRSESDYPGLFEAIPAGFCIVEVSLQEASGRIDYRVVEANPAFYEQTGFPKDVLGRWLREAAPALEEHWYETYGRVARTGVPARFEQGSDLLGRWFDVYAFRTGPSEARKVAILFNDISARRNAERLQRETEAALRESEGRFRNVADYSPMMMWVTDLEGRCTFLNRRWYEFTGQTPSTGLGYGWLDAVHPDDRESAKAEFLAATREQRPFQLDYRLRRHDGVYRWAIDAAAPRRSEGGEFIGFVGSVLDITDRKSAEQERERHRAELQTVLELLPVGVAIAHDPDANFITVSGALAKLLRLDNAEQNASYTGPTREHLRYRCQRNGIHVSGHQLPMQRACREGVNVRDDELDFVFADGVRLTLLVSASPLFDESGRIRGGVATHVDITALKQTQHALERADRQKDEFLAMLAHELRNPLAPIRNAGELLARSNLGDTLGRTAVGMIQRQVTHLTRLVDDLLDVSRITRGRVELKCEVVDVAEVIAHAVETVEPLLREKRHRIEVTSTAPRLCVFGDRARLVQCVVNLLTNSAKYTEPGGQVRVQSRSEGGQAVIQVIDSGIGIDDTLLPHVFDSFVQGDRTLDRSHGGLGIGLSVVKRLMEMHDGDVAAHSAGVGQGSTFELRLPEVERNSAAFAVASPEVAASRRVLVVDDNVDSANSLAMVLQMEGHEVEPVYTGSEAISRVQSFKPDVVLLDIGLPEMNGYEVAKRIRQQAAHVTLVALTGYGQAEDRERALRAGFHAHLVKPVDFEALNRTISPR